MFSPIEEPAKLRVPLRDFCRAQGLRGTVILSPEGLNCSLAGHAAAIEATLRHIPLLLSVPQVPVKYSYSDGLPFDRMLVKVKPRLLPVMDLPWDEEVSRATQLPAATLKEWLDAGKDIVLLDTRNDYEFNIGTFEGAVSCSINKFKSFKNDVENRLPEWRDKIVVTFCTGGIRCEKAAPLMKKLGFENIWQLEGGILQYFESVGGNHWRGDCFVFDQRVALAPDLSARPRPFCPHCGKPNEVAAQVCRYCRGTFAGHATSTSSPQAELS